MKFSDLGKGRVPSGAPKNIKTVKAPPPKPPSARPAVVAPAFKPESVIRYDKPSRERALKAYRDAVMAMRHLVKNQRNPGAREKLNTALVGLRDLLQKERSPLLVLTAKSTASCYLYAHAVNTAIFSMHLGEGLGWDPEEVRGLGWCALLCDFGLAKNSGRAESSELQVPDEFSEGRLHALEERSLSGMNRGISETVRRVLAEHDRVQKRDPRQAALIIGLCDLYEALSHPRAWREPLLPAHAVTRIMKRHGHEFPRSLLKVFIERISFYPPGSYLQIDSGEIACVIAINPAYPTRPLLEMRFAEDLTAFKTPLLVDMAKNPLVHVKIPLDETLLELRDKKLQLALKVDRWLFE